MGRSALTKAGAEALRAWDEFDGAVSVEHGDTVAALARAHLRLLEAIDGRGRIIEETPCQHGATWACNEPRGGSGGRCPGGSRRDITEEVRG